MGVAGLWEVLRPAAKVRSLTELAVNEGFKENKNGLRGFRIGIDASIWFFHAEYGREGENPVLRTLFFRCATLMHSPFLPLFVFDGPKRPDIKRGKRINKTSNKLIPGMKAIVEAFGFEWRMAPAEAEAELAYLNRIGLIDGILSDDSDNFLFGATTVIRNPSNNLSGNRNNPVLNAAGKEDKYHTRVFRLEDITTHPEVHLTRGGMILIGLIKGGDYDQSGLEGCGIVTAHGLAKCGFGDSLFEATQNLSRPALEDFLVNWRNELRHEIQTNSQGHLGRKQPSLAKSIPESWPNIDILLSYTNPITSESMGRESNNAKLTWSKEPDLAKLAETCEFYFEWGYKEAIIKRFRTVIWQAAVLRILRKAVLDHDRREDYGSGTTPPSTPPRRGSRPLPGDLDTDPDNQEERLIVKIHSEREHVSTDGLLEYRLEIAPTQLVRQAESGIKGTRSPEGPDEWASEEEDDEDGGKEGKKVPPDPHSHLRVWMPACMVRLVERRLVDEYEAVQEKKRQKKSGSTRSDKRKSTTAKKPAKTPPAIQALREEEEESASSDDQLPVFQPPPKATQPPRSKAKGKATATPTPTPRVASAESETTGEVSQPRIRDLTKKKPRPLPSTQPVPTLKDFYKTTKLSQPVALKPTTSSSSILTDIIDTPQQLEPSSSRLSLTRDLSTGALPPTSSFITEPETTTFKSLSQPNPSRSSQTTAKQQSKTLPDVIELSSDSDEKLPSTIMPTFKPLVVARLRAKAKSPSSQPPPIRDLTRTKKRPATPATPVHTISEDIIDLT
ncbi:hypothetical protein AX16_009297 [Volvariella volvacea WC 439]|nr:hypothetical protein AX16_009297 [Volvariella volvacea WC 439]